MVVDFSYLTDIYEFEKIIQNFQREIETDSDSKNDDIDNDDVNEILGENKNGQSYRHGPRLGSGRQA